VECCDRLFRFLILFLNISRVSLGRAELSKEDSIEVRIFSLVWSSRILETPPGVAVLLK
jgi:hypothetical protein